MTARVKTPMEFLVSVSDKIVRNVDGTIVLFATSLLSHQQLSNGNSELVLKVSDEAFFIHNI